MKQTIPLRIALRLTASLLLLLPGQAQGNRFTLETHRFRAEFAGALMTSFQNKLADNAEMLDAPDPSVGLILLRMATPTGDDLSVRAGDTAAVAKDSQGYVVTYRRPTPPATLKVRIRVDKTTGDLVVRTYATTVQPLYSRFLWIYPEHAQGRLLLPWWGGIGVPPSAPADLQDDFANGTWNMGAPCWLYERSDHRGGFVFWVGDGSTRAGFNCGYGHSSLGGRRTVLLQEEDWNLSSCDEPGLEYRFNVFRGNWSHGVGLLKKRLFQTARSQPPGWLKEVALVYNTPHLRYPWAISRVSEIATITARANATFPQAQPLKPNNILLYHNDWSADGHDHNYPDYSLAPLPGETIPTVYQRFAAEAKRAGYHLMPHFNANQVARFQTAQEADPNQILGDHWAWLGWQNNNIQFWNGAEVRPTGWALEGPLQPYSMYSISLGAAGFRDVLRDRLTSVARAVSADAVFLDTSAGAWFPGDVNPMNHPGSGQNFAGLRTLFQDLRDRRLVVGGELASWQTILAGQELTQLFPTGAPDVVDLKYLKYLCAFSGCLLGDHEVFVGHLAMPSPDAMPRSFWGQFLSCFFQGAWLNLRWPSIPYAGQNEAEFDQRGKVWAADRALYALNHHVRLFTRPTHAWNDDTVLIVERVDGKPVPRSEEWLVKMLICDWYWIYGGRAPSSAEFGNAIQDKHLSDGSLLAELDTVLSHFRAHPTPRGDIEPRGLALAKIHALFPAYPLVDSVVRWEDQAGEHVLRLVGASDPQAGVKGDSSDPEGSDPDGE